MEAAELGAQVGRIILPIIIVYVGYRVSRRIFKKKEDKKDQEDTS